MSNNSHVVVQWTINNVDFEVYELGEGFEFVIDYVEEDGVAYVVLPRTLAWALAANILDRIKKHN